MIKQLLICRALFGVINFETEEEKTEVTKQIEVSNSYLNKIEKALDKLNKGLDKICKTLRPVVIDNRGNRVEQETEEEEL